MDIMPDDTLFTSSLRASRLRQLDLLDPTKIFCEEILIVGVGNVGSWTALWLTKMGFLTLKTVDFDSVELHNVGSQFYGPAHVGQLKVIALGKRLIEDGTGPELLCRSISRPFEPKDLLTSKVVIMSVDQMSVRRQIVESWLPECPTKLFIDSRVGRFAIRVIAFRPEDIQWYLDATWFDDSKAEEIPCGQQSIIDVQAFASGLVARQVRVFMTSGQINKDVIFDVENLQLITGYQDSSIIDEVDL